MRTTRRVGIPVLAVSAIAVGASIVGGAAAANVNKDSIQGGFRDTFGENVGLQAQSGASGEDPRGHESATTRGPGPVKYRLKVVCLAVDGNLAAYGTVVVKTNDPLNPPGTEFVEVVRDGGLPGGGGDGWDLLDEPASSCADFLDEAEAAPPITHGNITIHDAQP